MSTGKIPWQGDAAESEAMTARFERDEMAWHADQDDTPPEGQEAAEQGVPMSPVERLRDAVTKGRIQLDATHHTIAASHDVIATSHDAREEARVLPTATAAAQTEEGTLVEQEDALTDPPRLPLRIREPAGDVGLLDEWRDVYPGDPAYDAAYKRALHAHRVTGIAMPYADAQDRLDAGETTE